MCSAPKKSPFSRANRDRGRFFCRFLVHIGDANAANHSISNFIFVEEACKRKNHSVSTFTSTEDLKDTLVVHFFTHNYSEDGVSVRDLAWSACIDVYLPSHASPLHSGPKRASSHCEVDPVHQSDPWYDCTEKPILHPQQVRSSLPQDSLFRRKSCATEPRYWSR